MNEKMTKEQALDMLRQHDVKYYKFLSQELRADKDILMLALDTRWQPFVFADASLRNDKDVVLKALKHSRKVVSCLTNKIRKDREFVKEMLRVNPDCIIYFPNFAIDKELAKHIVQSNRPNLQYLSEEHRKDLEVVLLAVQHCWQNVHGALCMNNDIAKAAVSGSWQMLDVIPAEFKNEELFNIAFQQNKWAINYFSEGLEYPYVVRALTQCDEFDFRIAQRFPDWMKDNEEYALRLVKNKGINVLLYLSDRLVKDRNFIKQVLIISEKQKLSFQDRLFDEIFLSFWNKDKEIIVMFLNNFINNVQQKALWDYCEACNILYFYKRLDKNLQNDLDILKIVGDYCKNDDYEFVLKLCNIVSEDTKKKKDFAMWVVNIDFRCYECLDEKLKLDYDVIRVGLKSDLRIYDYLPDCIKEDIRLKKFVRDNALYQINNCISHLMHMPSFIKDDEEICMCAYKKDGTPHYLLGYSLAHASMRLRDDESFMLQAIEFDYNNFAFLSDRLMTDKDFALRAIKSNPMCFHHFNSGYNNLTSDKEFMKQVIEIYPNAYFHLTGGLLEDEEMIQLAKKCGCKLSV